MRLSLIKKLAESWRCGNHKATQQTQRTMAETLQFGTDIRVATVAEIVCHCFQVSAQDIAEAIDAGGARTVEQVTEQTGAGGACQGCHCRIRRMLAGQSPDCGPCAFCTGCGTIKKLCACKAA